VDQDGTTAFEELLGRSVLFRGFDQQALAPVLAAARVVRLDRHDVVFAEGDPAEEAYVVSTGRIALVKRSPDGRESLIALMEPGDLFGEMPLFDGGGRSTEARAIEPTELLALPYPAVKAALVERPQLLLKVVELLARRLRAADEALADSMFLDVPGRTAKRLLELAGDAQEFTLPVTQEELAGLVGASRERVNKAIATFLRLGWLEQRGRRYRIRDRAQLQRRAS
jgi:CRP/FNR family cyclic AMP-dependent transcriptional regulator